jgi:hypothetical protein
LMAVLIDGCINSSGRASYLPSVENGKYRKS